MYVVGHRHVRVVEVDPEADPLGQPVPVLDVAEHRLAAALVELADPVVLDLGLRRDPELLLDLELDREAVAVPAGLAGYVVAAHRAVARVDVLERAREDVVGAGLAVRGRRPVVEAPHRRAGVAPLAQLALERPVRRASAPAPRARARGTTASDLRVESRSRAADSRSAPALDLLLADHHQAERAVSRRPGAGVRVDEHRLGVAGAVGDVDLARNRRARAGRGRSWPRHVHRAMLRPKSTSYCPVPTAPILVTVTPPLWLSSTPVALTSANRTPTSWLVSPKSTISPASIELFWISVAATPSVAISAWATALVARSCGPRPPPTWLSSSTLALVIAPSWTLFAPTRRRRGRRCRSPRRAPSAPVTLSSAQLQRR